MSGQRSKITALPSLVVCKDGTEKELNSLSEKDKNEFRLLICFNISKTMSEYYSLHNTEWKIFSDFKDNFSE